MTNSEAGNGGGGATILIVEDNVVNRLVLTNMLGGVDCRIVCVENGKLALDQFRRAGPTLILMDINMPVMDGIEATRLIREFESGGADHCHTPIYAVTAHDDEDTKQSCREVGMDGFIPKPVKADQLLRTVNLILNASSCARCA